MHIRSAAAYDYCSCLQTRRFHKSTRPSSPTTGDNVPAVRCSYTTPICSRCHGSRTAPYISARSQTDAPCVINRGQASMSWRTATARVAECSPPPNLGNRPSQQNSIRIINPSPIFMISYTTPIPNRNRSLWIATPSRYRMNGGGKLFRPSRRTFRPSKRAAIRNSQSLSSARYTLPRIGLDLGRLNCSR